MYRFFIKSFLLILTCSSFAQVGIGEENPSASLDIKGENNGMPSLRLDPQSKVTGSNTGQLAVIDDILYHYDEVRGKWLSIENTLLNFGLAGDVDGQDIESAGDVEKSGPLMPFDGTVVYASVNSNGGNQNKILIIDVYRGADHNTPVITQPVQLVGGRLAADFVNIDFQAGDHCQVRVSGNGDDIEDPIFIIWVKWRKDAVVAP